MSARADGDSRLAVLLTDYEAAREDERTLISTQAALFGAAVAITAFIAAAVTKTCQLADGAAAREAGQCVAVPDSLLAVLPLGPVAMIAFLQVIGVVSTIRSYYMRALEVELRKYSGGPLSAFRAADAGEAIFSGSYYELLTNVVSMRRGRVGFRLMNATMLLAILLIFGGLTAFIATNVGTSSRIAMIVIYGAIALLMLIEAINGTVGGRRLFRQVAGEFATSRGLTVPTLGADSEPRRSLTSYLVLPRPEECVKWTFLPVSFALGAWSLGGVDGADAARAAVVFAALEYLIYEARYQWNDIRGYALDSTHPEQALRRRLPPGRSEDEQRTIVLTSLAVALARMALAVAVGVALGPQFLVPILVLLALVVAISIVYEWLRAEADGSGGGKHSERLAVTGVWVWVGMGYAVRGAAGLWLAGLTFGDPALLLAIPMFIAFGVMFVTLSWVLEALSHCSRAGDERGAGGVAIATPPALAEKPHLRDLLPYLGLTVTATAEDRPPDCRELRALDCRGRLLAPWNLALAAAAPLAGAIGILLAGGAAPTGWVVAAAALSATGAAAAITAPSTPWRLLATVVTALVLVAVDLAAATGKPALAAIPWLVVAATFMGFRAQSYETLHAGLQPLRQGFGFALLWLVGRCVGRSTAKLIGLPGAPSTTLPAGRSAR